MPVQKSVETYWRHHVYKTEGKCFYDMSYSLMLKTYEKNNTFCKSQENVIFSYKIYVLFYSYVFYEQRRTYIYKNKRLYFFLAMILVWGRWAIPESSHTRRGRRESEEQVNNWLEPKFGNLYSLQLPRDLQQFLFFIGYSSHPCCCSLLATCPSPFTVCFPVATSMGGRICHHSLSSTRSIVLGDIPIITLLILSSVGCSC